MRSEVNLVLREDLMKRTYKIFAALLALLFLASSPSAQTVQYIDADILGCGVPGCRIGQDMLDNTPGICLLYTSPSPRD